MSLNFAGAVLAGGDSKRMGVDKAFLEVEGTPIVKLVTSALETAGASETCVVGGDTDRIRRTGLQFVEDRWPGEGPLGGLIVALDWGKSLGVKHVVVLGCDIPGASEKSIRTLVKKAEANSDSVLVPTVDKKKQWLHACWSVSLLSLLCQAFDKGKRAIHEAVKEEIVIEVGGLESLTLLDVDRQEDLSGYLQTRDNYFR